MGALTSCKNLEKNKERSLKTDGRTTDGRTNGQGRLLRTPSGKPRVQNETFLKPKRKGLQHIIKLAKMKF